MNTQINRMYFKQTLFSIVLMFACFPAFGSPAEWRGGYSDEWYQEGSKRFLPFLNHRNTSVWMLDFGQSFDFESAWLLYEQSQNIRHLKPERDFLDLYFSPRWRHLETVILQEPEIEVWQIPADTGRRFLKARTLPPEPLRQQQMERIWGRESDTLSTILPPEPLRQQQMVLIPAGEFLMGSNDRDSDNHMQPIRTVYVDAFYMDTTEVTNAQFKAFVDANPVWQKDQIDPRFAIPGDYLRHWKGNNYPKGSGDHPVMHVNWYAAMAYAEWVSKRLPTEAEWEYAARGGLVSKKYPNGDTMTRKDAHYLKGNTTTVARYAANGYGLYDMAGNVWEWCLDAYHEDFYDTFPKDGVARNPLSGANDVEQQLTVEWLVKNWRTATGKRVLRGGSFFNKPQSLRVAARIKAWDKWSNFTFGFRCARSLMSEQK